MNAFSRWAIVLVIVPLLGAGGFWLWNQRQSTKSPAVNQSSATEIPLDLPVESTSLTSATDAAAEGAATRQFIDQLFVHGITAYLPDLPVGQFYAGWLIKSGNTADAVSTGKLLKQGDVYTLDFSSPVDYSSYTEVLVTQQSGERKPPETEVIKGLFPTQ